MNDLGAELPSIQLTELAHGGGCGCKLAPAVLQQLLTGQVATLFPQLLVGTETSDDAAVWQISDELCVIATTDFFMPIADDPHDFGRIATTNAISDVYAMGGVPILALAILGMPLGKLPVTIRGISSPVGPLPVPALAVPLPAATRSTPRSRSTGSPSSARRRLTGSDAMPARDPEMR
jgi:hypothetical protein